MKKILFCLSNLILLILCIYAIHDMQTAQGVGYYFSLRSGGTDRLIYDLVTDTVFILLLCICLIIPMILCKKKTAGAFSRFLILFAALIPTVRTDYAFNLFFGKDIYSSAFVFTKWLDDVISSFSVTVPFLILVLGYYIAIKKEELSLRNKLFILAGLILILPGLMVPAVTLACLFIACYLFVYVIFDCLESTAFDSPLLYGFLFVTAVFKLLNVTAAWGL